MTQRQERFCAEFVKDFDPDAAARRAGYQGSGAGARLLCRPELRDRIGALHRSGPAQDGQVPDAVPERERVLRELSALAYGGGGSKPSERLRALELLGRYLGLFSESGGGGQGAPVIVDDVAEGCADAQRATTCGVTEEA